MIKVLLIIILSLFALSQPFAQMTSACLPAKDSVWTNKSGKLRRYVNRTIFVFENGFDDTVSVIVDKKLITKRYMESTSAGAVIGVVVVPRPWLGEVVIKTNNSTCTQFCLSTGYLFAYINLDRFGKWFVTYSNYERIYY